MINVPKSVPVKYRNRIAHWDDERGIGNSLIVTLNDGWKFPSAECHTEGFDTVKEAVDGLRGTQVCECSGCRKSLASAVQTESIIKCPVMSVTRVSIYALPKNNATCDVKAECVYRVGDICDEPRINKGNGDAACHRMSNKVLLPLLVAKK